MAPRLLLAAVALLLASPLLPPAGAIDILESVPDLERAMYLNVENYPCVRLLNLSGEIGCSNPGREKVVAPITKFKNTDDQLTHLSAILLPLEDMQNFFLRKPIEHFLKALDEVTLEDITSISQKIISSPLTMASWGDVINVPSYESVSRNFRSK